MLQIKARGLILAAVGVLCLAGGAAADSAKCTVATKGDSPVAQACARGGRAEAKKVMKGAVKAAKDNGGKFTCDNCHKSLETFELKPNARDDFKKLLEQAGGQQPAPAPAK
jgi:hypothetical protein